MGNRARAGIRITAVFGVYKVEGTSDDTKGD